MPPQKRDIQPAPYNTHVATVRSVLIENGVSLEHVDVQRVGSQRVVTLSWNAFAALTGTGHLIGVDHV